MKATESDGEGMRLVGVSGEAIEVPAAALRALKRVAEGMSGGLALSLIPYGKELTTQEAADLLHVSAAPSRKAPPTREGFPITGSEPIAE